MRPLPPEDGASSRVRAWFDAAAEAGPRERARIIAEARAHSEEAAAELESLLLHLGRADGVMGSTPLEVAGRIALGEDGGVPRIAGFRIVREIGRGGMGVVYEAEQEFPRRRVALKVVRPELIRGSLVRRFAREVGVLALLQHEGIARLYESGFTDQSRTTPYLVMELIEGEGIAAYVRGRSLGTRGVLDLVARVCDGVDHAHRRGVVHRDLKPGNILVTGAGTPKVLDFGVARLTEGDEPDHTMTEQGLFIGTLGYMSPEQLAGQGPDVDHRSDVFALGVVLYELLAGRPPLDLSRMSITQAAVAVREREPEALGKVNSAWRGDVEAIAGKAMEKDRERRYQSAAELGADIRRHLANEPVQARPQTTWYQARKFARRHRGLVAGLVAAMVALVAGAAGTSWQAVRATRQRDATEEQSLRARETAALLKRMVKSATPERARGTEPTVRQMLAAAAADLAADTGVHPVVAGDTHLVLAESFGSLGDFEKAKQHALLSERLREGSLGARHPDTILAAAYRVRVLTIQENFEEAVPLARELWERAAGLEPDAYARLRAESVYGQALVESDKPDFDAGIPLLRDVYDRLGAMSGQREIETLSAGQGLGIALSRAGKDEEAVALLTTVLEGRKQVLGEDHPETLRSIDNLNVARKRDGIAVVVATQEDLVARAVRLLGGSHPSTIMYRDNLVQMLYRARRLEDLVTAARQGIADTARPGPPVHSALMYRGILTSALIELKRLDEAESAIREHRELCVREFGESSPQAMQVVTLDYDLAEARGSLAGMREAAEKLRGTPYEEAVFRQLREAEEKAKQ